MPPRSCLWVLLAALVASVAVCGCPPNGPQQPDSFRPPEISVKETGELKELTDGTGLTYRDPQGEDWTAPKGTLTDGASVPRLALPVTDDPWGREFLKAAVVHDAYCQEENRGRPPFHTRPWRKVHRMFYDACLAGGTHPLKAQIMYAAVWLGGPRWEDPEGEARQASGENLAIAYAAARTWVDEQRPPIRELQLDLEDREVVLRELSVREAAVAEALGAGTAAVVEDRLRAQEAYLQDALRRRPNDTMLASFQGNLHRSRAVLYQRLNQPERAREQLDLSEERFNFVIRRDPQNPVAPLRLRSVGELRRTLASSGQPPLSHQPLHPVNPVAPHAPGRALEPRSATPPNP